MNPPPQQQQHQQQIATHQSIQCFQLNDNQNADHERKSRHLKKLPRVQSLQSSIEFQINHPTHNDDESVDDDRRTRSLVSRDRSARNSIEKNHESAIVQKTILDKRGSSSSHRSHRRKSRLIIRKFQKLDESQLSCTPAPDVKIGQRVAYKEYYGNEFGTIRWIGRVPQICPEWTAGVEFDNAIGEGDGSLNGRRYFIAKDCFAKFLPLCDLAFVDQHVGRPEPGTMISVMSAAVRPGQMISIQRVSTVHVQHCFLNAPHQIPGAELLAVNTRLHCQCPNCGPCAHVIKPPRTQRLTRSKKNATHMCQFSTYTCCGMESQEELMCSYTGNKASSTLPPVGNSWFDGAGYLTNLQAQQSKLMPDEYKMGAAPEDISNADFWNRNRSSSRRGSERNSQKFNESNRIDDSSSPKFQDDKQDSLPVVPPDLTTSDIGPLDNDINTHQENPPSYSPNPDYTGFREFSISCPDKSYRNRTAPYVEPVWCEASEVASASTQGKPKSARVVYRDSIENRYLFPTDEPIDSLLEADLENLSQARYGNNTNRLSSSKNIFKSLRSLVSCLSAQSNRSDFERRSENTLRLSEYADRGTSKAIPEGLVSRRSIDDSAMQSTSNCCQDVDFDAKELRKEKLEQEFEASEYRSEMRQTNQPQLKDKATNGMEERLLMQHISSSSDCGFSSASQNSINFQPQFSPSISMNERQIRSDLYNSFLTKLMESTTIKDEELLRLRRILFELNSGTGYYHNRSIINRVSLETMSAREAEKILTESFQRCLQDEVTEEGQSRHGTGPIQNLVNEPISSGHRTKRGRKTTKHSSQSRPSNKGMDDSSNGRSRNQPDSSSESATLSSYDSFSVGDYQLASSSQDNNASKSDEKVVNNLPKAFELKLTLSINSDNAPAKKEDPIEISLSPGPKLSETTPNSIVNVNITQNNTEEGSASSGRQKETTGLQIGENQ